MEIILAKTAGFCFGVNRAVNIAQKTAEECSGCVTFGQIIHNNEVVKKLEEMGVYVVNTTDEVKPGNTVIIRSHGVRPEIIEEIEKKGARVIDATCPDVSKIHKIVKSESEKGRRIVIVGEKHHPEVDAISGWCKHYDIIENKDDAEKWVLANENQPDMPVSVVSQTTMNGENFETCINIIKKLCTNLEIFDTICRTTSNRQKEADELSRKCDGMIVIGGKHSANSNRLADICRKNCSFVRFIETADDIDISEFKNVGLLGITAGASTPAWIIKEVYHKMSEEIKVVEPTEETESFEELLEKSIKTLHTGDKVVGTVAAIGATDISVDLGTKQSGYIPLSELTDDPSANISDIVKVGDEIETFVIRVNDVEGTVMLSKKRLDAVRVLDDIADAKSSKDILEGTVSEVNKGGVVVNVKGIRVFVPASQTGLPRNADMNELLKKKVKLTITELNQSRRRVVGSIREAARIERKAKADAIWNEIEVGKHYEGTVKSLTSYGAFVDIGGIDGMVHVSELTWTRIKQPSEVVSVGDKIDVYVISFDKENNKISLGHKDNTQNPWDKFVSEYSVDSVAPVKIIKLMPFGAFAEIIPGVDGLIHISQIADRRIGKPDEVLSEGQVVDAKIVDINEETKKVSLSIRALLKGEKSVEEQKEAESDEDEIVYDTDAPAAAEAEEDKAE